MLATIFLALTTSFPATAETLAASGRFALPGTGVATDDGPESTYVNPALIGFDYDAGYALVYRYNPGTADSAFRMTTSVAGLGLGVSYSGTSTTPNFWTIDTSVSMNLPDDLTLGWNIRWNLPEGEGNNFTSWDLGMGYRPLPWLGFGGVAQDIGSPAPELGIRTRYGVGLAVRPFGDTLMLGVDDFFQQSDLEGGSYHQVVQGTLKSRVLRGIDLRLYGTSDLEVGGGIQVFFGDQGIGAYASAADSGSDLAFTGAVLTSSPPARVGAPGKRIPEFMVQGDLPYDTTPSLFSDPGESYIHFLKRLQSAADDPSVRGVLVHLDNMPFSFAQIEEVRSILGDIRAKGLPVVVYMDEATSNGAYLLATAGTRVLMHPATDLDLIGLAAETTYYRGTLDLVGIEPQFYRRAEYKSAVETYTRTEPSEAASDQMNALLDDLQGSLVSAIAQGRDLEEARVQEIIDGGPYTAEEAVRLGLVDGLCYEDQIQEAVNDLFPKGAERDDRYLMDEGMSGWKSSRSIAIVNITGVITSGESSSPGLFSEGSTGSETIVKALKQARKDNAVKAVVLRVDSPGGSSMASDKIWHAVQQVQEADKPVIVSMGGTAASGGYYVAAGAKAIYAQPTTVTGSIGVYGGKLSTEELYEKIGLNVTTYTRGRRADMWSSARPFDAVEGAAMDRLIGATYEQFKSRVAEGRGMEDAKVEEVARGRVWSGQRAKEQGLVDEMGGLWDAVERARLEAGLSPRARVNLVTYGSKEDAFGDLPTRMIRTFVDPVDLPPGLQHIQAWSALKDEHVFLMMPYQVEVQ